MLLFVAGDWKQAKPGWQYEFPRDHHAHRDFKTEWWYFTGNVFDADGHRFGYELTFFRQGITPPTERHPDASRFLVDDLKFAHFALTDVSKQTFRFEQKMSRGAFGEAGFDEGSRLAWIDNWTLSTKGDDAFDLMASTAIGAIHLHLQSAKPPIAHGENGMSMKAAAAGHGSHYYSLSRLQTTGEFFTEGKSYPFRGESWFDHEWATSQLASDQVGWNWLCVQFEDGRELMLYQMRLKGGAIDPISSGTFVAVDGSTSFLPSSAFRMAPSRNWKSKKTGADYPVEWLVEIPSRQISFTVRPALENQELALGPLTYWEGAIDVSGKSAGTPLSGRGYLELTGYAPGSESPGR